jgi:hypothetical protein
VTRRLLFRWAFALLLVVGTSASYGAATQLVRELKARSCCTHDCGHGPTKTVDPSRCCGVAPAGAAAVSAPAAPTAAPTLSAVSLAAPAALADVSSVAVESPDPAAARAAPVFLLTRSLRI